MPSRSPARSVAGNLVFLADFCQLHKDRDGQRARDMAVRTLERMAAGGIHDHVGHVSAEQGV